MMSFKTSYYIKIPFLYTTIVIDKLNIEDFKKKIYL